MNLDDAFDVCQLVAMLKPAQRIDPDETPRAWLLVLGHLERDDVLAAVVEVAKRERWVDPADLVAEVKRIRRARIEAYGPLEPQANPDDVRAWQRDLRALTRAVADGTVGPKAVTAGGDPGRVQRAIAGTFRNVPDV